MAVLVTGGAGYIGTHTCVELVSAGFDVVVVDNLSNSSRAALQRVEKIIGREIPFIDADIRDRAALQEIFGQWQFEAVIHFAGHKAVGESVQQPLRYYQNNVEGTLTLCDVMAEHGVKRLIFSSSATVYGDPVTVPITEDFATGATNPYGASKLMVEEILRDCCKAPGSALQVSLLRYFNPIGAHESGTIGEDPRDIPNNLLPYVAQVAVGRLEQLSIFGDDYDTVDGTGVRDYIHVVDLARGHVKALQKLLDPATAAGCFTYNLGTGNGNSVLEIVQAFARISGREIPYRIAPRRPGDIAACYADASRAERELGWRAEFGIERMIEDTWRWQSGNPEGYAGDE
ncbi:UDP-glucose 4-epimerase GalE [Biformimicrobium ophioploci]|uniref:UDP-glucose 4-epimerase n=1 Tax=Biformimicrobium ophioploci TaxID=3036711 RepID=A0ABQ6LUJ2_9GAMM|nr:UDP-glucose 4-epimerase GalE [Microbulbifer sp. NKW57]GMG85731.1 UDP-glucose 4-epimerase GalE [Microbulbifer sp. NKW57]